MKKRAAETLTDNELKDHLIYKKMEMSFERNKF